MANGAYVVEILGAAGAGLQHIDAAGDGMVESVLRWMLLRSRLSSDWRNATCWRHFVDTKKQL